MSFVTADDAFSDPAALVAVTVTLSGRLRSASTGTNVLPVPFVTMSVQGGPVTRHSSH